MTARTHPIQVTDATFEEEVVRSEIPVVVDFYADWCAPCRVTEPMIRELSAKMAGRVKFTKVNVDEASAVARSYGIHSIPTFLFLQDGHEKGREVGPIGPVEFRSILRRHFSAARSRPSGGKPVSSGTAKP
jgi:thioredoxin 1